MPLAEIGDPRLQALFGASDPRDAGVRPTVRLPRRGLPRIALLTVAAVLAVLLFAVLDQRRLSQTQPSVRAPSNAVGAAAWQAPPPLRVPAETAPAPAQPAPPLENERPAVQRIVAAGPVSVPRAPPIQSVYMPQPVRQMAPPTPATQPRASAGAPLVIDTAAAGESHAAGSSLASRSVQTVTRMRASALANRSMTVTQGTLIAAVLETGLDSTRPGFARAVVSRNVRSFDGSNVLIPRGSKLIGDYRSEAAQGQQRAMIIWTRLIRPDGMTITMDSPAVDPLGRGGVPASVNTHFWSRFGDALLQTTVGIGGALAQRSVSGPVVIVPGSATAAAGQLVPAGTYVPTLTVPAGKSISVFVAHDLDFSAAKAP